MSGQITRGMEEQIARLEEENSRLRAHLDRALKMERWMRAVTDALVYQPIIPQPHKQTLLETFVELWGTDPVKPS